MKLFVKTHSTKVELAVLLLTVDNIEDIWNISLHVAHFKIKPLMMASSIDIWHKDEVILFGRNLKYKLNNHISLVYVDSSTEGHNIVCLKSYDAVFKFCYFVTIHPRNMKGRRNCESLPMFLMKCKVRPIHCSE